MKYISIFIVACIEIDYIEKSYYLNDVTHGI